MEDSLNVEGHHSFSFNGESFEGFHDGVSDFHSDYLTDRQSPSADQVYVPYYDIDTKWRSISLAHPSPALFRAHGHGNNDSVKKGQVDRVDLVKGHSKKNYNANFATAIETVPSTFFNDISRDQFKDGSDARAPSQPFLLMNTHFETSKNLSVIKETIREAFASFPEISYDVEVDCTWNAVFLRGSMHCKIQISIYSHGAIHIVEANRLSGDGSSFRTFYAELKSLMLNSDFDSRTFNNFFDGIPMPASGLLSDDDVLKSLEPILVMARSNKLEAQLEASRMLCDLSLRDDIQQQLCDSGCLAVLVQVLLPVTICEQISHHALLALANLSEAQSCQGVMIDAGVLPALLTLATDGPYNSAEVSRESARILANLSSRMAARVVDVLGPQVTANWMASVDNLLDGRLKLHASRAKDSLQHVISIKK